MAPPPGTSPLALGLGQEPLPCPHCPGLQGSSITGHVTISVFPLDIGTLRTVFSDFFGGSSMGWALRGASGLLNTGVRVCVCGGVCLNWTQGPTKEKTQAQRGGRDLPEVPQQEVGEPL